MPSKIHRCRIGPSLNHTNHFHYAHVAHMTRLPLKWNKTNLGWHDRLPEYELIKVQILTNEHLSRRDNVLPVLLNEEARQLAMNNPMLSFKPQPFWLEAIDPLPIIQLRVEEEGMGA